MKYRVWCDFIVEADNSHDVEEYCGLDLDFVERHVIVDKAPDSAEEPYEDITGINRVDTKGGV